MTRLILCLFLSCFVVLDSQSQCTIHGVDGGSDNGFLIAGNIIGQTFTACQSGVITSISVSVGENPVGVVSDPGIHNLRIGPSTNPPTSTIGGPVYQTFMTSGGPETITIVLDQPFPVANGMVYAFDIEVGGLYVYTGEGGDYDGGTLYIVACCGFRSSGANDLDFGVEIEPNPIPTLGEWGLIVLGMLLLVLGSVAVLEKRFTFALQ